MNQQILSPASFQLLKEMTENNNDRDWFQGKKEDYKELLVLPLSNITHMLRETIHDIDKTIETRPEKCLSRIYNDQRFGKNKPYLKSSLWITFKAADIYSKPAFFFEIEQSSYRYGMGYFQASAGAMEAFREKIHKSPSAFAEIAEELEGHERLVRNGESYKREKESVYEGLLKEYYNLRTLYFSYTSTDLADLYNQDYYEQIKADFRDLRDMYYFLAKNET